MPATRVLVAKIVAEAVALLGADLLLLRIWAPDLVNLHKDWALALSLVCVVLAIALTAWLGWTLWVDVRRLIHLRRAAIPARRLH